MGANERRPGWAAALGMARAQSGLDGPAAAALTETQRHLWEAWAEGYAMQLLDVLDAHAAASRPVGAARPQRASTALHDVTEDLEALARLHPGVSRRALARGPCGCGGGPPGEVHYPGGHDCRFSDLPERKPEPRGEISVEENSKFANAVRVLHDVATGTKGHVFAGTCPNVAAEGASTRDDRADPTDDCEVCEALKVIDACLPCGAHSERREATEDTPGLPSLEDERGWTLGPW